MRIPWHRLFGLALKLYLKDTAWQVDVEVELVQPQRLDVVVLRRSADGPEPNWPDGFGAPALYNLLTFKALQDPLDGWALDELAAHRVAYRKHVSPDLDHLLPVAHFRMLAVSMRFPRGLSAQIDLRHQADGTYDVQWGIHTIRVLVLNELPEAQQNLVWNLFSSDRDRIASAFHRLPGEQAGFVGELLEFYKLEGLMTPYTLEELEREVEERILRKASPETHLKYLSPEQRLEGLSLEEIENYLKKKKAEQEKTPPPQP